MSEMKDRPLTSYSPIYLFLMIKNQTLEIKRLFVVVCGLNNGNFNIFSFCVNLGIVTLRQH